MADDQSPDLSGAPTETLTNDAAEAPQPPATPAPEEGIGGDGAVGEADVRAEQAPPRKKAAARKRPAKKAAASDQPPPSDDIAAEEQQSLTTDSGAGDPPTDKPAVKKTTRKRTAKKAAAKPAGDAGTTDDAAGEEPAGDGGRSTPPSVVFQPPPATPAPRRKPSKAAQADDSAEDEGATTGEAGSDEESGDRPAARSGTKKSAAKKSATKKSAAKTGQAKSGQGKSGQGGQVESGQDDSARSGDAEDTEDSDDAQDDDGTPRRRRRRGGRRRRGKGGGEGGEAAQDGDEDDSTETSDSDQDDDSADGEDSQGQSQSSSSRRRRRRRRSGEGGDDSGGDPENTVTKVRSAREAEDEITSFTGSTRLEAKKQRRREGREAGRRRAPVISEAEFLARRESVDRTMVIRQRADLTQIAVMEDKVLVEHYVARESQTSIIGNVYLGKVQNVLPSMEAAFIDIGRGRNAVLYAGEVNWDALGAGSGGKDRKIEQVLKPGQAVLVQVTKDPIGHKGARLTSQISLPGRFLVYVPEGSTSGISRKLPDTERNRLKTLLKEIVPSEAGVIVRTAAEGAAEEELRRDVTRLTARWEDIQAKVKDGNAPAELYSEPDLTLKVVRDLFTEDIKQLVVSGDEAWEMVHAYVEQVAPDLVDRLTRHDDSDADAFAAYRIDEQINKALERKVWLPSGGSLIIDRTEAMTVVDVNTGKFTGSGGNLEETVTKNNLEAAEEIVRQLRLRDIGGIIVIDFIDMVLESNRELVLRRLIECLGRDRTRHQVAEVTSLGLVQMTRKRIGTGLLEAFSEPCEHCQGRGMHVHAEPVEPKKGRQEDDRRGRRGGRRGRSDDDAAAKDGGKGSNGNANGNGKQREGSGDQADPGARRPTPAEFAAMAARQAEASSDDVPERDGVGDPRDSIEAARSATESDAPTGTTEPVTPVPDPTPEPTPGPTPGPASEDTEQGEAETPEPAAEPEEKPATAPATAPVDGTPRIVTSTRRRGARRAAGPPREETTSGAAP